LEQKQIRSLRVSRGCS